jgi:hypothetical protein
LLAVEGPNEPGNFGFTYNGIATTTSWQPVAQWQSGWYATVHGAAPLAGIPVWSPSLVGEEGPGNWGLQYLTVPAGPPAGVQSAAGTVFADVENEHLYPGYGLPSNSYIDPTAGDAFQNQTAGDWVTTYLNGYAGYSSIAVAMSWRIHPDVDLLPRRQNGSTDRITLARVRVGQYC